MKLRDWKFYCFECGRRSYHAWIYPVGLFIMGFWMAILLTGCSSARPEEQEVAMLPHCSCTAYNRCSCDLPKGLECCVQEPEEPRTTAYDSWAAVNEPEERCYSYNGNGTWSLTKGEPEETAYSAKCDCVAKGLECACENCCMPEEPEEPKTEEECLQWDGTWGTCINKVFNPSEWEMVPVEKCDWNPPLKSFEYFMNQRSVWDCETHYEFRRKDIPLVGVFKDCKQTIVCPENPLK